MERNEIELRPSGEWIRTLPVEDMPAQSWWIVRNGSGGVERGTGESPFLGVSEPNGERTSDDVLVVGCLEERAWLLVGAVSCRRSPTYLTAVYRSRTLRGIRVAQPDLREGDGPEEIVALRGDDWRALLRRYGGLCAARMGARSASREPPAGWCSWYCHGATVSERDVLAAADALAASRAEFPARVVQIDSGYQRRDGDWTGALADGWPSPLAATAAAPVSALRAGLAAIREAVPDAWILGCGAHHLATLGLVDANRMGCDTAAGSVPKIEHAALQTLAKFWTFGRWFAPDPDVAVVRGGVPDGAARISALAAILTGCAVSGDRVETLTPGRLALLGRAARIRVRDIRPGPDAEPSRWPRLFLGTLADGRPAAAILNARDEPFAVDPAALEGFPPGVPAEELLRPLGPAAPRAFAVPPHDAALLVPTTRRPPPRPSGRGPQIRTPSRAPRGTT